MHSARVIHPSPVLGRSAGLAQIAGGIDEAQVREGLREVPHLVGEINATYSGSCHSPFRITS